jgi:hypothetical protein
MGFASSSSATETTSALSSPNGNVVSLDNPAASHVLRSLKQLKDRRALRS